MSFRYRSSFLTAGAAVAGMTAALLWQASGRAQVPNVPPTQKPEALEQGQPLQARPAPPGEAVSTDQIPNESIQLWSYTPKVPPREQYTPADLAQQLLQVRISNNFPGGVAISPHIVSPVANDPEAVKRGMQHFIAFNCIGCHANNGGGGEGPALSDQKWLFGSAAENIYLTIVHGRKNGMPAFGGMLPDQAIWELAAYVQSIAEKPTGKKGVTISRSPQSPAWQQVPAEAVQTDDPWAHVEPFTSGKRPQLAANTGPTAGETGAGGGETQPPPSGHTTTAASPSEAGKGEAPKK